MLSAMKLLPSSIFNDYEISANEAEEYFEIFTRETNFILAEEGVVDGNAFYVGKSSTPCAECAVCCALIAKTLKRRSAHCS